MLYTNLHIDSDHTFIVSVKLSLHLFEFLLIFGDRSISLHRQSLHPVFVR